GGAVVRHGVPGRGRRAFARGTPGRGDRRRAHGLDAPARRGDARPGPCDPRARAVAPARPRDRPRGRLDHDRRKRPPRDHPPLTSALPLRPAAPTARTTPTAPTAPSATPSAEL